MKKKGGKRRTRSQNETNTSVYVTTVRVRIMCSYEGTYRLPILQILLKSLSENIGKCRQHGLLLLQRIPCL